MKTRETWKKNIINFTKEIFTSGEKKTHPKLKTCSKIRETAINKNLQLSDYLCIR